MDGWDAFKILGIGNLDDPGLYMKFAPTPNLKPLFTEVNMANPPVWEMGTPSSYKFTAEIRDENGKSFQVPLQGVPEFEVAYPFDEEHKTFVKDPNLVIESIYQTGTDGKFNVLNGPFTVKGAYEKVKAQWTKPEEKPVIHKAQYVNIVHNGETYKLAVGDTFTINYDVQAEMGGKPFTAYEHAETVLVTGFDYDPAMPAPSPFLLNKEAERTRARQRDYERRGDFSFDWIEALECFVINGHFGKQRYEIILGEALPNEWHAIGDVQRQGMPVGLVDIVRECNRSLINHFESKSKALGHPKLHSIMVVCPGLGKDTPTIFNGKTICDREDKQRLYDLIQHLNDSHQWSREAIAEWIDTLEEQPVFYPVIESSRVANSAKVVAFESPF